MKFLITGNTGFKGTWLSLMLNRMGHEVFGVSLVPEKNSFFELGKVHKILSKQFITDIRNQELLKKVAKEIQPEVIVHLAAQPLVRESYLDPRTTYETNVMGTFNLLESTKNLSNLRTVLVITTDKVYQNLESQIAYRESDPLGGSDPYSSSKAMADLLTQSWIKSFAEVPIQIARAGNVVAGGDFSQNRLIPDLIKNIKIGEKTAIRYPHSVRPWQHVLDCLAAYIGIIDFSLKVGKSEIWNVGPGQSSFKTVNDVLSEISKYIKFDYYIEENVIFHEDRFLVLDSTKIEEKLGWFNLLNFEETIKHTSLWYESYLKEYDLLEISIDQIEYYKDITKTKKV